MKINLKFDLFLIFKVVPFLYELNVKTAIVTEISPVELNCYLLVGTESNQTITWTWSIKNNIINSTSKFSFNNNQTHTGLILNSTITSDSGFYTCTASNEFGNYSRTIKLIVKSIKELFLQF